MGNLFWFELARGSSYNRKSTVDAACKEEETMLQKILIF